MKKIYKPILLKSILLTFLSVNLSLAVKAEDSKKTQNSDNPKPASASVYNLGLKSYEQGDIPSAISFFKRAIDLDPTFVDAYYNLGAIYKKQKSYSEATNLFHKAVDLNPKDTEALYELSACYFASRDYQNAKKYYSQIPTSFNKYPEVVKNLKAIDDFLAGGNVEQKNVIANQPKKEGSDIDIAQAQLLANTLTKEPEKQKENIPVVNKNDSGNLLVNALAMSDKEQLKDPIRIVGSSFNGPTGIAKDSKNNLYIANFSNDSIERIKPDGTKEIFIDKVGLLGPVGVAIDDSDNLYIANYNGNSIAKVSPERMVTIIIDKIVRPYYLYFDKSTAKLFATVQGNDSLIEIDTKNITKLPITFR